MLVLYLTSTSTTITATTLLYNIDLSHSTTENTVFDMHRLVYAIFWLLCLWFFVWPVAFFCAWFWIFLQVRKYNTILCSNRRLKIAWKKPAQYIPVVVVKKNGVLSLLYFACSISRALVPLHSPHHHHHHQPLEACFPTPIQDITAFLEKLVTWPRDFGHAIANCQTTFPAPV